MTLNFTVNFLSAICASCAAVFWFMSAKSFVDVRQAEEDSRTQGLVSQGQLNSPDFVAAQKKQIQFSYYASIAACGAALFQSIAILMK